MAAAIKSKTDNLSNGNLMIVLLLISLLAVGVTALVGKSLTTSIIRDTKVREAKAKADKQLKANVENAPRLVDAYKNLGETAPLLADALPTTADFPSIIVTLENMSKDAAFALKSVVPAVGTDVTAPATAATTATTGAGAKPQSYAFTVNFVGTYDSLHRFYADVETSARPMRVKGMQLSGSGSALTGVIDMETYFQDKAVIPITTENIK